MFERTSVMDEVDVIPVEEVEAQLKAEREDKVLPAGKFQGTILSYYKVEENDKRDDDPYKGKPLYKAGVTLYDCPDPGKKRIGWFKFSPDKSVTGTSGKPKTAYTSLVGLTKATNTVGQPVTDTLEQAKVTRCTYNVAQTKDDATGELKGNWLRGISVA